MFEKIDKQEKGIKWVGLLCSKLGHQQLLLGLEFFEVKLPCLDNSKKSVDFTVS